MEDFYRFLTTLQQLPVEPSQVTEYRKAVAVRRVLDGEEPRVVAPATGLTRPALVRLVEAVRAMGLAGLIPDLPARLAKKMDGRRKGIAQILLGRLAERRFELLTIPKITEGRTISVEPRLEDRSTTDYLITDESRRPACRINAKFHGTLLRDARKNVGLEPEDCFGLATYKIYSALERQRQDGFPFVFFVLSVPGVRSESVAEYVPEELAWLLAVLKGGRLVEEAIADHLGRPEHQERFQGLLERVVSEGEFRVISATKAERLLHELLFRRVFAIRVPRFVQATQVNMHLSLSQDLAPLETFLQLLNSPLYVVNVRLYEGKLI